MSRPPSPSSSSAVGGDSDTRAAAVPPQTTSHIVASAGWPSSVSFVAEVDGYSRRIQGPDSGIHISRFVVGGYRWCLKIYPDGQSSSEAGWVSVYLQLHDDINGVEGETVMAQFKISLLGQDGEPVPSYNKTNGKMGKIRAYASKEQWGHRRFIAGHVLQRYLRDDCFRLKCQVFVHKIRGKPAVGSETVAVPPSDLQRHLRDLLRSGRGGDVSFEVGDEIFAAHRYMLAARSPVFMAELFGPMAESAAARVRVDDMEPRVFEAMLEFVYTYTDSWPEVIDAGETVEMAQHLLVAADRYNLERLKLICEGILCDNIDRHTVATILALAEQHGRPGLKQACFNFLRWIPSNLKAVMASQHLRASCPSLVKDIVDQAAAVSRSHVLKIEGYSRTKRLVNDSCIMSIMFVVGGHHWYIKYYPDGHSSEHAGWISVFLALGYTVNNGVTVKARYQISLLDFDGNQVPSCSMASETPCEFSIKEEHGGELVERKVLEGTGYLKNDSFSVRCDVTIAE